MVYGLKKKRLYIRDTRAILEGGGFWVLRRGGGPFY